MALKQEHPDRQDASVLLEPDIEYDHLIQVMDRRAQPTLPASRPNPGAPSDVVRAFVACSRHLDRRCPMKNSRRIKRMSRNRMTVPKMNITSLMDIFTILVFFLLVNSANTEVLETPKQITLPASVVEEKPRETVVIFISADDVTVQGESVATHLRHPCRRIVRTSSRSGHVCASSTSRSSASTPKRSFTEPGSHDSCPIAQSPSPSSRGSCRHVRARVTPKSHSPCSRKHPSRHSQITNSDQSIHMNPEDPTYDEDTLRQDLRGSTRSTRQAGRRAARSRPRARKPRVRACSVSACSRQVCAGLD